MKRILVVLVAVAAAQASSLQLTANQRTLNAKLAAHHEVPIVISGATGEFKARVGEDLAGATVIDYELSYEGLEGTITQAHIHAAQPGVNGGIIIWLCSNLASPPTPAGTQPCPAPPATISGTIRAANVVGAPTSQAIPAGNFDDALEAILGGNAYANVHSTVATGGELRGQIR
jgi:CHRD domain